MIVHLQQLFARDLNKLANEIGQFSEQDLWKIKGGVKNSAGNLCLHLVGNLNTYIGKNLGNTGYIRNRDAEFNDKNHPKVQLLSSIEQTKRMVDEVLVKTSDTDLQKRYPEDVLGYEMTTGFFLIHLFGHLSYHLGQINYLRRVL